MQYRYLLAIVLFLFGLPHVGWGSEKITISCTFPESALFIVTKDGKTENDFSQQKDFSILYVVERGQKTATMIGNNSTKDVQVNYTSNQAVFYETTPEGNTTTTSVFLQQVDGKTIAVHSRHIMMLGDIILSQMYGTCTIK